MAVALHILDLYGVDNVPNDPLKLTLKFPQKALTVDREVVSAIILWMRANQFNGGYYSLDLGAYVLEASRPYKNQHRTHKYRLESKLSMFKHWFMVNRPIKVAANRFGHGGIIWFEDEPHLRVFRNEDKDYSFQKSAFIKYALGKL